MGVKYQLEDPAAHLSLSLSQFMELCSVSYHADLEWKHIISEPSIEMWAIRETTSIEEAANC